jgi:hypothetical protein
MKMDELLKALLEASPIVVALAIIVLLIVFVIAPQMKRRSAAGVRPHPVPEQWHPPEYAKRQALESLVKVVGELSGELADVKRQHGYIASRVGALESTAQENAREWKKLEREIMDAQGSLKATREKAEELCERIDGMKNDMREDFRGVHARLDLLFKNGGRS